MRRRTIYIQIVLPLFLLLFSSITAGPEQKSSYVQLTIEDGLPDDNIRHIMQDSRGLLWFATANGVARYDGHTFKIFQCHPFDQYSLSACSIQKIYEDTAGNIWVVTVDYLNLFDPVKERFIRLKGLAPYGRINTIYQSVAGEYYIGTEASGMLIVKDFKSLKNAAADSWTISPGAMIHLQKNASAKSLSSDSISTIYEDRIGDIWIGSKGGGLNRLSPHHTNSGSILDFDLTQYRHLREDASSLSSNAITSFAEDSSGCLWVGTINGLNQLVRSGRDKAPRFIRYHQHSSELSAISDNNILSLQVDREGDLWVGTSNGLDKLITTEEVNSRSTIRTRCNGQQFNFTAAQLNLQTNRITAICEDNSGIIWLGSSGGGVYKLYNTKDQFNLLRLPFTRDKARALSAITAIFMHSDKLLWVGTKRGSLLQLPVETSQQPQKAKTGLREFHLSSGTIYSMLNDDDQHFLVATQTGLLRFNRKNGSAVPFSHLKDRPFEGLPVYQIIRDKHKDIWVATEAGLHQINPQGERTAYLANADDPSGLRWPKVWTVYSDRDGFIWIGTKMGGISRLDPRTGKFIHHKYNSINSIYQDQSGTIWFGSYSGGLSKLISVNENDFQLKHFFIDDGLPSNRIQSILEDTAGYLWLSTINGVSRFDPKTEKFRNFSSTDGLQGLKFNRASSFRSSNGALFFGGNSGLNQFIPAEIVAQKTWPAIIFTEFRKQGERIALEASSSTLDRIELSYQDNIVTIKFSALDFNEPSKNQYAYRLDGLNEDWIYIGNQNSVTFTNLQPGNYSFRVKASNSHGIWNEQGIAIDLLMAPPWWQTWWFRSLLFFSFLILALGIYRIRVRSIEKQKDALEKLVAERTLALARQKQMAEDAKIIIEQQAEKLIKADQLKSRFFTNISHEFRTPLSLIISPLKELLARNGNNGHSDAKYLKVMYRNSQRLLNLINQLLEISKLEAGDMKLNAEEADLVKFLRPVFEAFLSEADRKNIKYEFVTKRQSPIVNIDKEKFEKIVYNLLSNAFKFTPHSGKISLVIERETENVQVTVTDSGIGIPQEQLQFIFNRFYQVDNSSTRAFEGSGLGLALSKELISLHDGTIMVFSEQGKGSRFIVSLPISAAPVYAATEKSINRITNNIDDRSIAKDEMLTTRPDNSPGKENLPNGDHSRILTIIEDNQDILDYLTNHFSNEYQVVTANNGLDGIDLVKQIIPDLIICDVMMPEKDGYEVCHILKQDEKTNHIPIIMLTAKASLENKLQGLQFGADDYITKPFEIPEIETRIRNLIDQRRQLKTHYSRQIFLQPHDIAITSVDEAFLQKLCTFVETHLEDPDLASRPIEQDFNMTKRQFQRKVKALTDQTPSLFIRAMRLKRAKQLIESDAGSISEIAFQTGFNNLSYFARSFREHFGHSPSQLEKNLLKE